LVHNAKAYLNSAFEFSRVFTFKWSVNWQFWGEEIATGKDLAFALLVIHLTLLVVFLFFKWTHIERGLKNWLSEIRLDDIFGS